MIIYRHIYLIFHYLNYKYLNNISKNYFLRCLKYIIHICILIMILCYNIFLLRFLSLYKYKHKTNNNNDILVIYFDTTYKLLLRNHI